jgi:hypothetical protein
MSSFQQVRAMIYTTERVRTGRQIADDRVDNMTSFAPATLVHCPCPCANSRPSGCSRADVDSLR